MKKKDSLFISILILFFGVLSNFVPFLGIFVGIAVIIFAVFYFNKCNKVNKVIVVIGIVLSILGIIINFILLVGLFKVISISNEGVLKEINLKNDSYANFFPELLSYELIRGNIKGIDGPASITKGLIDYPVKLENITFLSKRSGIYSLNYSKEEAISVNLIKISTDEEYKKYSFFILEQFNPFPDSKYDYLINDTLKNYSFYISYNMRNMTEGKYPQSFIAKGLIFYPNKNIVEQIYFDNLKRICNLEGCKIIDENKNFNTDEIVNLVKELIV